MDNILIENGKNTSTKGDTYHKVRQTGKACSMEWLARNEKPLSSIATLQGRPDTRISPHDGRKTTHIPRN